MTEDLTKDLCPIRQEIIGEKPSANYEKLKQSNMRNVMEDCTLKPLKHGVSLTKVFYAMLQIVIISKSSVQRGVEILTLVDKNLML